MTKRILPIFFVLVAMILPAAAAKSHRHHPHSIARGRKLKSKSARKSVHKSTRHRAATRRQKLAKR